MHHIFRVMALAAAATFATLASAVAQESAASYPSKPITVVVPFPAGGPPDIIARVIGQPLGQILGTSIVIDNRSGAGSALGASLVARAAPDGYTLLAVDISVVAVPHINPKAGFDPIKDFKMIGQSSRSALAFMTAPSTPAKTAAELVAYAKREPDKVTLAHSGIGSTPHLGAVSFLQATGLNSLLVSYRGVAPATSDILAGRVTGIFTAPSSAIGLVKDGKAKVLGITGHHRVAALPEVATFEEGGIVMKGFEDGTWYGFAAPAETPDDIVAKLNAALNKALQDKAVVERLAASDIVVQSGSSSAFTALTADQYRYWGQAIKAAGVKPEE